MDQKAVVSKETERSLRATQILHSLLVRSYRSQGRPGVDVKDLEVTSSIVRDYAPFVPAKRPFIWTLTWTMPESSLATMSLPSSLMEPDLAISLNLLMVFTTLFVFEE